MQVLNTIASMRTASRQAHPQNAGAHRLGLVPTMGALHEGHLSLVRRARGECSLVAASIFVNPLQFGPGEDLARYPRQTERDLHLLNAEGVDLVFLPPAEEMYPAGSQTAIEVSGISERLDGAHRPGHFRGVATVVAKLLHIVQPDRAYFGQKDAVQVAVIRRMLSDLNFETGLVVCPIVRDPDGLALSSRNAYLSAAERMEALALPRALQAVRAMIADGTRDWPTLAKAGRDVLKREPGVRLEYLEAADPVTLEPAPYTAPGTLVAVAASVGTTRLIDNFLAP